MAIVLLGPSICQPGEAINLLIAELAAAPASIHVFGPNMAAIDITSRARAISSPPVTGYIFTDTPGIPGQFFYLVIDATPTKYWFCVTCSGWAANMDIKISEVKKQRTDIDRLNVAAKRQETR